MENITQEQLDNIATYMHDRIREDLHGQITDPTEFVREYVKRDPEFIELLRSEFPAIAELIAE